MEKFLRCAWLACFFVKLDVLEWGRFSWMFTMEFARSPVGGFCGFPPFRKMRGRMGHGGFVGWGVMKSKRRSFDFAALRSG